MIGGVSALIIASLPPVRGRTIEEARWTVELASSGIKHVLKYALAAGVKKIVYTGTFQNTLHPSDTWKPITVSEEGKSGNRSQEERPTECSQTGTLRQRTTATSWACTL